MSGSARLRARLGGVIQGCEARQNSRTFPRPLWQLEYGQVNRRSHGGGQDAGQARIGFWAARRGHYRRHRHTRHHRCRGGEMRCAALMPHPAPCAPTPPAVLGWRRGWRGCWLPQALAALLAVLSGCFARRRSQLPSSRASQDLKKGCSDKSRFFLACTGPCRPDLKLRPIP